MEFSYSRENTDKKIRMIGIFKVVFTLLIIILIAFGIYSLINQTESNFIIFLAGLVLIIIIYIIYKHLKFKSRKRKPREIVPSEKVKVISSD